MELTTGVYSLPQTVTGTDGESTYHLAAVETPKGVILIDAGNAGEVDRIEAGLAEAGHDWADVRAVLITHQDGDHVSGLAEVCDRTGAVVYAHERCVPFVDGREQPIKSAGDRYEPVDVDVSLVDGVSFRTAAGPMDVVFTPGHAPGHVSLCFPDERLLLAADALTADENGLAAPWEGYTLDMDRALESAGALADRPIDRVLCYHGGFVEEGATRIGGIVRESA